MLYPTALFAQAFKLFVFAARALWFSMFPWAKFRRSGGEDCDDEAQHSDARAAPKAEEKTDYGMTKVQIWRGDAKLGSNQWETMEDLTDVSDDEGGDDDGTAPETEPIAKQLRTEGKGSAER